MYSGIFIFFQVILLVLHSVRSVPAQTRFPTCVKNCMKRCDPAANVKEMKCSSSRELLCNGVCVLLLYEPVSSGCTKICNEKSTFCTEGSTKLHKAIRCSIKRKKCQDKCADGGNSKKTRRSLDFTDLIRWF